jgi:hypothetical protein
MSVSAGEFNMFFNFEMRSGGFGSGTAELDGGGRGYSEYATALQDYQAAQASYQMQLAVHNNMASAYFNLTGKKLLRGEPKPHELYLNLHSGNLLGDILYAPAAPSAYTYYMYGHDDPPGSTTNTLPSLFNWTNTGANAAAYGAYKVGGTFRLMKSGSVSLGWYKSGWSTGNQYVKTTYSLSKLGNGVGIGTSFVGAFIGVINFRLSDKSWGDYGQLGMSFLSSGLTCFPATTPVGIVLGVIDITGGFNGFYNYLDENQHLYNSTGLIMIPGTMGIPTFLNLK